MSGKFLKVKYIAIPVITLVIIASQILGSPAVKSRDLVQMMNSGQNVVIELVQPSYDVVVKGERQEISDWVVLEQLRTFQGFRQDFDAAFNINIVTERGIDGKSGVLFVNELNERDGNTTLMHALRNKVFINKYWKPETKNELAKLGANAYTDITGTTNDSLLASINAYYNLVTDYVNPKAFNASQSMTREQFYALVFRSANSVREIEVNRQFKDAIGGETKYSIFAQEVAEHGFLNPYNGSLDGKNIIGSISRAEAIYTIVNMYFAEQLAEVTGRERLFTDARNGGNLALRANFKQRGENREVIGKDKWQAFTLAYMLQNPNHGLQEELYSALVVANQMGLIGTETRWDEPISRAEALQLVIDTHLKLNELHGFLSDVEYGKINPDNFLKDDTVLGEEDGLKYGDNWSEIPPGLEPADANRVLDNGMTLGDMRLFVDRAVNDAKLEGEDVNELLRILDTLVRDYGTTLEEVMRVRIEEPPAPKPAPAPAPTPPTPTPTPQPAPPRPAPAPPAPSQPGEWNNEWLREVEGPPGLPYIPGTDPGEGMLR